MELEVGKIYKIKFDNKIKEIGILKKNKRNYRVILDNCHELLWGNKNNELYFIVLEYGLDTEKMKITKQKKRAMVEILEELI